MVAVSQAYIDYFPFDYQAARAHAIKPHRTSIPLPGVRSGFLQLQLTLDVSPAGNVTDVKVQGDLESLKLWPRVRPEITRWKFIPFEHNGKPVNAEVEEHLDFVPPERIPRTHVRPPVLRPDSDIKITLQRTGCLGLCPVYTVSLGLDGIHFNGRFYVASIGDETAHIDPDRVRALAEKFIAADFYSMAKSYRAAWTDSPTYILTLTIDGRTKSIEDYEGPSVGMPAVITELEDEVDKMAQSERWIKDKSPDSTQ